LFSTNFVDGPDVENDLQFGGKRHYVRIVTKDDIRYSEHYEQWIKDVSRTNTFEGLDMPTGEIQVTLHTLKWYQEILSAASTVLDQQTIKTKWAKGGVFITSDFKSISPGGTDFKLTDERTALLHKVRYF
jgi:hypothetical protein